jgi:hypothetical protein
MVGVQAARCGITYALIVGLLSTTGALANRAGRPRPAVPIMVGGPFTGHNCTELAVTMATVMPMKPDAYLAVRAAPDLNAKELERIKPGHPVIICTNITNKLWVGVLYRADGEDDESAHCGLYETRKPKRSAYNGPCRSGWVARRYLWLSAG